MQYVIAIFILILLGLGWVIWGQKFFVCKALMYCGMEIPPDAERPAYEFGEENP